MVDYAEEGSDLEIVTAVHVTAVSDLPGELAGQVSAEVFRPYCRIRGYFEKRTGAGQKPYAIGFGISLPDDWNGRFLFQGGGGLNGLVREPLGALASGDVPALFRGFAVVSTDSGHQSDTVFDVTFFQDQQALLNFYSQAVYKTTLLGNRMVSHYYEAEPKHQYFSGCSTGGREGMTMSQRYPDLFDGIIVGAPARRTNYSEIADLWSAKTLQALSSANGGVPFSEAQQALIVDSLLQQCDSLDGLEDGFVMDVAGCDFDPAVLQCTGEGTSQGCLSQQQVKALGEAFAGPRLASGENIYPGFYYDTGISAKAEHGIPGLLQGVAGPLGKARIDQPFDLQREIDIAENFPLAPGNATLKNLTTFAGSGHKLFFFHGVSDPWFSAKDTQGYYLDMAEDNGGLEAVKRWSKLYFVPGMGHCHGGERALDRFDMLSPLVDWVESGSEPERIPAWSTVTTDTRRRLCPYPDVSRYRGEGDPNREDSFQCVPP
ncbi:tannase/feruloyl esterase family alpha/beta hydrolase [Parahaliea maris]|nr:tannase/feruloyl esterase family alpha/beta hydrolase [Parahaliea maris]